LMDVSFILVMGHLYLALLYPKTRHALSGITRGWVDEEWALQHHRKWAEKAREI
jgi:cytochrome b subunit of formate dehydrogenase